MPTYTMLLLLLLQQLVLVVPATATPAKRNVLFLMSDDLRPELGSFGAAHIHSPNIDALARSSLVLAANYVQQAVCGPTRASLLVGRRPDTLRTVTHTSPTYWRQRAGDFVTIPQMFKERGWTTLSFGKVFDLRTSSFNQSSEWICDGPYSWSEPPQLCGTSTWVGDSKLARGLSHRLLDTGEEAQVSDVVIAAAAVARLGSTELRAPWFVAVGLHRPHLPFIVPKRHLDLYPLQ
jgi:iduronate 2-sulfatase